MTSRGRVLRKLSFWGMLVIAAVAGAGNVDPYNIVWTNQSSGSVDSMPLAGGNLGLNVWVEKNDLLFLISSPNCMDENGMQVKLGLVRLKFAPAIFGKTFRQELRLDRSEIVINGKTASGQSASVTLWCDMDHPVIHAEFGSGEPVNITASYETWSSYQAQFRDGGIQWMRRLPEQNPRRLHDMQAQGMSEFADKIPDPLSKLTCGGRLDARDIAEAGTVSSKFNGMDTRGIAIKTRESVKRLDLTITLRMEQDETVQAWEIALNRDAQKARSCNLSRTRRQALEWWKKFWDRSYIIIAPTSVDKLENDKPWQVARNYQLFRYMLSGNASGRMMTLFNGGLFACDGNPDRRMWDGCQFMAQNQRLVYWPLLRSGDFDMLKVGLDVYRDRTPMSRLHAKKFWGVEGGVAFSEGLSIFGLDSFGGSAEGRCAPEHLRYHFTSGMEFALMMLEMERYTGKKFPGYRDPAEGMIAYYDQFYQKTNTKTTGRPLDEHGKLVIYPSDALELYHGCKNNTDVVAGLTALTRELLALPAGELPATTRAYLESFRQRSPDFPIREKDGKLYYAPAESCQSTNLYEAAEFPQMYVCFPFNIAALGRPGIEIADATWDYGAIKPSAQKTSDICWFQGAIQMARLGRTTEAAARVQNKFLMRSARFPAFWQCIWNGYFDGWPDTDHGGCAMIALQEMLMQTDGRRILLGPAWPAEWSCDFKLHAPYQTTVEGRVRNGKVIVDKVAPARRKADIEIFPLKTAPPPPLSRGKPANASSTWPQPGYEPGKAVDGDPATRWSMDGGQGTGWLEVDLGKPISVSRVVIQEQSYPQTTRFAVESQLADGSWKTVAGGTTIGVFRELKFPPTTSQKFRLKILDSKLINAGAGVTIDEMELFNQ